MTNDYRRGFPLTWSVRRARPSRNTRSRRRTTPASLVEEIASFPTLRRAYDSCRARGGQAPGPDGLRYDMLSDVERFDIIRATSRSILGGTYIPGPTRRVRIPKASGGHRTLELPSIVDRMVARAVAEGIADRLEAAFVANSFGFRRRLGTHHALAVLAHLAREHNLWVIATDDIRRAFPSVNIDAAVADFRNFFDAPRLLGLNDRVLRGHDHTRTVGLGHGNALSPLALNARLHWWHDLPRRADGATPPWIRYADDLAYLVQDVPAGRAAAEQTRRILEPTEFRVRSQPNIVNLRRQGAHLMVLGLEVSRHQDELRFSIPDNAYRELTRRLDRCHTAENPVQRAEETVRGWIAAYGPALETARRRQVHSQIRRALINTSFLELIRPEIELGMCSAWEAWQMVASQVRPCAEAMMATPGEGVLRRAPRTPEPGAHSAYPCGLLLPGPGRPGEDAPF